MAWDGAAEGVSSLMARPCCTRTQRAATGSAHSREEKVTQYHAIKDIVHAVYKIGAGVVGGLRDNLPISPRLSRSSMMKDTA